MNKYPEHDKLRGREDEMDHSPSFQLLKQAMEAAARQDTAHDPVAYMLVARHVPLQGHCAAAAYVVQRFYGGDIVTGRIEGVQHYWNRLPDGSEIDLTSDQFSGDGIHAMRRGRAVPPRKTINPRFALFEERVHRILSTS